VNAGAAVIAVPVLSIPNTPLLKRVAVGLGCPACATRYGRPYVPGQGCRLEPSDNLLVEVRGFPARQVIPIPGSSDVLVVVEYADFRGTWPNLFRVGEDGQEVWAARPGGADAYTQVALVGTTVHATTHYGRQHSIDVATGVHE
jgi:hypothetical protein